MDVRQHAPAIGLAAVLIVFVAARVPVFREPGLFQGWTSDAAILGLMAKKIADGRGFDFYFWGQNFIGPLTSIVAAVIGFVRSAIGATPAVGPMALRLASSLLVFAGIVVLWIALRRTSAVAGTTTALFLSIGPPVLLLHSVVARSTEVVFFLGAVVTWFGATYLSISPRQRHWFLFGILCGISWWMNQQIFFFVAGVLWLALRRTGWLSLENVRLRQHLLFRYSGVTPEQRALLLVTETLLILQIVYVILRALFGWSTPVPGFRYPLVEPLLMFLVVHVAVAAWQRDRALTSIQWAKVATVTVSIGAGFVVGFSPVLLGRARGWVDPGYVFGTQFLQPSEVVSGIAAVFTTALPVIFGSAAAAVIAALVITLFLLRGRSEVPAVVQILVITAAANLTYSVLAEPAPFRSWYLIASVPGAWALTALALTELREQYRVVFTALSAALIVCLAWSSAQLIEDIRTDADPRPVIATLRAQNCRVVYAEYWTAYKYRFLSDEEFLFIVHQSQDRTARDSAVFAKAPGRRCLLEPNGRIKLMHELPAVANVVGQDVLPETIR